MSANNRAGTVVDPLLLTSAVNRVVIAKAKSNPVKMTIFEFEQASMSMLPSMGWVGRLETALTARAKFVPSSFVVAMKFIPLTPDCGSKCLPASSMADWVRGGWSQT
jgi:hypothetical protein